jgi:hypothetical protein
MAKTQRMFVVASRRFFPSHWGRWRAFDSEVVAGCVMCGGAVRNLTRYQPVKSRLGRARAACVPSVHVLYSNVKHSGYTSISSPNKVTIVKAVASALVSCMQM